MYSKVRPQGDLSLRYSGNFTVDCYVPELPYSHHIMLLRRDIHGIYNVFKLNQIIMEPGDQLSVNYAAFTMHRCRVDLPSSISSFYSKPFLVILKGLIYSFIFIERKKKKERLIKYVLVPFKYLQEFSFLSVCQFKF